MDRNQAKDEMDIRAENAAERADVSEALADALDDIGAIEENTELVVRQAAEITITDDESYEAAAVFLVDQIKAVLAAIAETFDPIDDAQKALRKVTIAARKKHEAPLKEAETVIKSAMGIYWTERDRIAKAEEEERLELARREAEDRAVEEAARLERTGHQEAADERLEAPVVPVVTTPAPKAPKAKGSSVRMTTKFRIIDASKIGPKFLMPDEKKIRQIVNSFGADAVEMVGGIEVYEEPVVSARAAR